MSSVSRSLGLALQYHQSGNLHQAEILYRQILQVDSGNADALHLLGLIAAQLGKYDTAVDYMKQALRHRPDYIDAYNNLGNVLKNQGKLEEAIANYQQALRLKPDFAEAYNNLGSVLNDLGHVLHDAGKIAEALANYQQALRLRPADAEVYYNAGNALRDQRNFDEAITCYRQAVHLRPDFAEAYNNLGHALMELGKFDEAIGNIQQSLRLRPDADAAHSSLVFYRNYDPDSDSTRLCQEARSWYHQHAEPLARFWQLHDNNPDPERRLRIGYVSPDFRNHPVAYSLMPLLSNHDHGEVETFCYAEVARPDDVTERLRACADGWRVTVGLTNQQMAAMVRRDQIDILVDLALHTFKNRLLLFAHKPAPVQVSWCGYPGTTGLSAIDYRLTDRYLDPPGETDADYSEQSIRLPDSFWCYDPMSDEPLVNELPALASGSFTFGCLNAFWKVNDGVLALWAQVLRAVPRGRLLLMAPVGHARDHVLAVLKQHGIDENRVDFIPRQPRLQYFQMYHRIDLALDCLPYNGHVTSLDAFWMGVPTITLIGKTVAGRAGWSQLCNLGLKELAAQTPAEFVALAVQFAADLPRLQHLRATLRSRLRASPLMDGKRFAHNMEQAFRQMWRTWCQDK